MDSDSLQQLAQHNRARREIGATFALAAAILTLALWSPAHRDLSHRDSGTAATSTVPDAFATVPLTAKAAIVYDLSTHTVLYDKEASAQLPLASLTKLLTVYAAVTHLPADALVTIPPEAAAVEAPRAFSLGQRFSVSDLSRITLTASLNDGATALLKAVADEAGSTGSTVLASAAEGLDLAQTYAVNGSGLDLSHLISGGYGSARDVAVLAGALADRAPIIAHATTEPSASARATNGAVLTVRNTDPLVSTVPHLLLSKTGYTDLAGGNLAIVFDVGMNHPIAIVVLGSSKEARFTDVSALVAATLAHFAGFASL